MSGPIIINDKIEIPAADLDYDFSRAGGPGGQHVNTTDTRVRMRFSLSSCAVLTGAVKERLRMANRSWLTSEGDLLITSDVTRSRHRNIEDVRERLAEAVRGALKPPKTRRPTKPSKRAKQRRLDDKKKASDKKSTRKKVTPE